MNKCLECNVDLSSEWDIAPDTIQLCHPCYEVNYTVCGDHLTAVRECGCKL